MALIQRITLVLVLAMVNLGSAVAAPKTREFDVKVKFDHTFYTLTLNKKNLVYAEGPNVFSMNIKDCNKSILSKITKSYETLSSSYKKQSPTKYDVELIDSKGATIQVSRGSDFGTWLRDLPKKIMYYNAEAQVLCKK